MENGQVTITNRALQFSLTLESHRLAIKRCGRPQLNSNQEVTTFLKTLIKGSPEINAAICNIGNDEDGLGSDLKEVIKRL